MEYAYIVQTPDTCSGRPRIAGTRIAVEMIADWIIHQDLTPALVCQMHPHLSLAQIHSALAYYYDHTEEIEASRRKGEKIEQEIRQRFPSRLAANLQI
jgi:uncharacterized protein (DUF433 family)